MRHKLKIILSYWRLPLVLLIVLLAILYLIGTGADISGAVSAVCLFIIFPGRFPLRPEYRQIQQNPMAGNGESSCGERPGKCGVLFQRGNIHVPLTGGQNEVAFCRVQNSGSHSVGRRDCPYFYFPAGNRNACSHCGGYAVDLGKSEYF